MQAHDTTPGNDQSMDLRLGYCIHVGAGSMWHYHMGFILHQNWQALCHFTWTLSTLSFIEWKEVGIHKWKVFKTLGEYRAYCPNIKCTARIPASVSLHEMSRTDSSMLVGCGYLAKWWLGMKGSTIQYNNIHKFVLLYKMAKILCQGCLAVSQGKLFCW